MSISNVQKAKLVEARTILAAVLESDRPSEELAERLEDAANLILDISEDISLEILASRTASKSPVKDHDGECP